jgi:membrane-associated phospholipid phosphatase
MVLYLLLKEANVVKSDIAKNVSLGIIRKLGMGRLLRLYRLGFLLYLLVFACGTVLVLSIPKTELHMLMNQNHTVFQDWFFRTVTWLGDGWIAAAISCIFLFVRYRYFFMLMLSFSISGLLAQFIKHFIFPGAMRPAVFLEQMPEIQTVAGVGLYHSFSMPSGHTTTAFAVLLLVGFITKNKPAFFLAVILAWCVAISRVYLSQHFLVDVVAGSFLGTLSALFFYWYFQKLKPEWLNRSLLDLLPGRKKQA